MSEAGRLSRYLGPRLSEARLARQWSSIASRIGRRPGALKRGAGPLAAATALAAAALGFILLAPGGDVSSPWDGAILESGVDGLSFRLEDGSHVQAVPGSLLVIRENRPASRVIELKRGSARFDVSRVPDRSFVVRAGLIHVAVVGTRFSVSMGPAGDTAHVTVAVEEGIVQATSSDGRAGPTRIGTGETWTAVVPVHRSVPPEAAVPRIEGPDGNVVAEDSLSDAREAGGPASLGVENRTQSSRASSPPVRKGTDMVEATEGSMAGDAGNLFEAANTARREGDFRLAAEAYEQLLDRYPSDERAGLAAFELGRLRMDQLGDFPGAARALEQAMVATTGTAFREDALARLVRAYATMGAVARCKRAKRDYLGSYPTGVHAGAVRLACGGGR